LVDIIELGIPFTDAVADGPTIRQANSQALLNGVTVTSTLEILKNARKAGLRAPVILMGYYNPLFRYGDEKLVKDAKKAGANGFIVVDLPPEEARSFRRLCRREGYVDSG
jgi:tryptophan synthase